MLFSALKRISGALAVVTILSGCAAGGLTIPINDPQPSKISYSGQAKSNKNGLNIVDSRAAADKVSFSTWIVPMNFVNNGKPLDPIVFVAEHTTKELASRGTPVKPGASSDPLNVKISKINIENHRVSAFSPMVTLTSLVAEIDTPSGTKRVSSYVKRAKVPVWSFDELNEPCYNEPMDLITKELAAKINREVYGLQIADAQVDALLAKINSEAATNPMSYLDVYQLGFGNNPRAIEGLAKLTSSPHEYVRLAAISSLGILKARSQQSLLESLYKGFGAELWQDRAIAIKAIGDLDTPESKAFLQAEFERMKNQTDKGSIWTKNIIALYL